MSTRLLLRQKLTPVTLGFAAAIGTFGIGSGGSLSAQAPASEPDQEVIAKCRGADGYSADFGGRRTFLWRPQWLESIAADEDQAKAFVKGADAALERGPYSVTDKERLVPGATPNDYTSIGPYWWPNPGEKDGLPYERRDGEVNPERNGPNFDKDRLRSMGSDLEALSVAYYLTSDERYADHAAKLLVTWFLNPETRMAPNMDFAQGIPGRVRGRGEGIIEASDLSTVVEAIGLLGPSDALSADEHTALRVWYAEFATWMATSENGEKEMQKRNNHGVFYDFYLAHFAIFAGLDGVAANITENFPTFRLGVQMDKQGRFIEELKRTRSWHYSNYVVAGAGRLATISECTGQDLWKAQLPDGRSLQTANAFLERYADDLQAWPFPDRDHASGRFDRMKERNTTVVLLFDRGNAPSGPFELP